MIVYVHAKLHMRKYDEAKLLRILKARFYFWWCCNWSKGSCNIWLVMKTRKTQGIILNCLKQDGFSMQTEHGYVLSRTNPTIRSNGLKSWAVPRFEHDIILNDITINSSLFSFSMHFYCFETPDVRQLSIKKKIRLHNSLVLKGLEGCNRYYKCSDNIDTSSNDEDWFCYLYDIDNRLSVWVVATIL